MIDLKLIRERAHKYHGKGLDVDLAPDVVMDMVDRIEQLERTEAMLKSHAKFLLNQVDMAREELNKEQRNKSAWGKEQIEAERETNAMLTDQLEKAEAEIARLREALQNMLLMVDGYPAPDYPFTITNAKAALSQTASAPAAQGELEVFQLDEYDVGHLNDYGGGDVEWWRDYIRAELGRAYEFYQSQVNAAAPKDPS